MSTNKYYLLLPEKNLHQLTGLHMSCSAHRCAHRVCRRTVQSKD